MRIRLTLCALVLGEALFSGQAATEGTTIVVGENDLAQESSVA